MYSRYIFAIIFSLSIISSEAKVNLIFSNDGNLDDLFVLPALFNTNHYDVKAVTVVGSGFAFGAAGASNFAKFLKIMGVTNVPVAYGNSTARGGNKNVVLGFTTAPWLRPAVSTMMGLTAPGSQHILNQQVATVDPRGSVVVMEEAIQNAMDAGEKVTIYISGTCTDVAELFEKNPDIKEGIEEIVIQGGTFNVSGNLAFYPGNTVANYNAFLDPVAYWEVLHAGIPVTISLTDAANYIDFTLSYFNRLSTVKTLHGKIVFQILSITRALFGDDTFFSPDARGYHLWDSVGEFVMRRRVNGGDSIVRPFNIVKDMVDSSQSGKTFVDTEHGVNTTLYITAKLNLFENDFFNTLNRGN
jgi:inosine-uridine nucleoside N-ribohydrolase